MEIKLLQSDKFIFDIAHGLLHVATSHLVLAPGCELQLYSLLLPIALIVFQEESCYFLQFYCLRVQQWQVLLNNILECISWNLYERYLYQSVYMYHDHDNFL